MSALLREMQLMMAPGTAAAPAFVGSTTHHNQASVSLPEGAQAGDYVLLVATGFDNSSLVNTVSLPADSAVVVPYTRFGVTHLIGAWGHILTASEVTAGSVAFGNTHAYGFIALYRPVGDTPVNAVGTVWTTGSGSGSALALPAPGITTDAYTALLFLCSVFSDSSTDTGAFTAPTGFVENVTDYENTNYAMGLYRKEQAAAGATGDVSGTWNSTDTMTGAAAVLFALNAGETVPPPPTTLTTTPTVSVSDTAARVSFRTSA